MILDDYDELSLCWFRYQKQK